MAASSSSFESLLVHYPSDNTFSVISSKSKNIVERNGKEVKVKWPKQGIFEGKIIDSGITSKIC